jgi:hypothetical protein
MIFLHRYTQLLHIISPVGFGAGSLVVACEGVGRWFSVIYGAAFYLMLRPR